MSDALIGTIMTALIAALPPCVLAYLAFLQAKRAAAVAIEAKIAVVENTAITAETKAIVEEVGRKTDGQLSELVAEVRSVADAAGFARGVSETNAATDETSRIAAKSAADRAEGLAEGRAEARPPGGTP